MKTLLRKFRQMYQSYNYAEQDIDILLNLFDIVLEMMDKLDVEDCGYMKKLSSFIQILSSGYSNTIIDAIMIEEIYDSNIVPILNELESKYVVKKFIAISTKEIVNGIPHIAVTTDKDVLKLSEDFLNNNIGFDTYRKAILEEMQRDREENDNGQRLFNMSKDVIGILYRIYDSFTNGRTREHKEDYLKTLVSIKDAMETISMYDNISIQLLSDNIRSICYTLVDELNTNDILPPSSIALLEMKFKAVEAIKFKNVPAYI